MVTHVVLFRPRPDLTLDERRAFITALDHAFRNIPLIKRAQIGRRLLLDRHYDELNAANFPFVAILEFDSEQDLRAYLEHPAHQMLGTQFYVTSDAALVFDFEIVPGPPFDDLV